MTKNVTASKADGLLNSCIYQGWVRHRRWSPRTHQFSYQLFMLYVDLQELEAVLTVSRYLLSRSYFAVLRFVRRDFHGPINLSIRDAVIASVQQATGKAPEGRIMMLANWRFLGFNMNPLSTYYCFDKTNSRVEFLLAEVNNTPWDQRHAYILSCDTSSATQSLSFAKVFQVSPFNPLLMEYRWVSTPPAQHLLIHIENWLQQQKIMDATLQLQRLPFTAKNLRRTLIRFPFMTVKVLLAIYWQALRLWCKKTPLFLAKKILK